MFDDPEELERLVIFGRPIVDTDNWRAEHFFHSERAQEVCAAISAHDYQRLRRLLRESGVDCNLRGEGRAGLTLLHWAYAEHDLEAFKILLEAGASPDLPTTDWLLLRTRTSLATGDSILFATLRHGRYDFFLEAFAYSQDVDETGGGNEQLLHVLLAPDEPSNYERFGLSSEDILADMLRTGMTIDIPNKYCSYPTHLAAQNRRTSLCLMLLKAGASPTLENGSGQTIVDILAARADTLSGWNGPGKPREGFVELLIWLKKHDMELPGTLEAVLDESAVAQESAL
ncbi:ankyrin repeat domain-containing protein [Roseimaritima ulvae]|uniref:hypothetical protein n=1 Tax=Roseimaritima ulvae TaxID=980254 RepID=UPI00143D121E|nr:hypothetical protein [Roseimaritima ulvae]